MGGKCTTCHPLKKPSPHSRPAIGKAIVPPSVREHWDSFVSQTGGSREILSCVFNTLRFGLIRRGCRNPEKSQMFGKIVVSPLELFFMAVPCVPLCPLWFRILACPPN